MRVGDVKICRILLLLVVAIPSTASATFYASLYLPMEPGRYRTYRFIPDDPDYGYDTTETILPGHVMFNGEQVRVWRFTHFTNSGESTTTMYVSSDEYGIRISTE